MLAGIFFCKVLTLCKACIFLTSPYHIYKGLVIVISKNLNISRLNVSLMNPTNPSLNVIWNLLMPKPWLKRQIAEIDKNNVFMQYILLLKTLFIYKSTEYFQQVGFNGLPKIEGAIKFSRFNPFESSRT